MITMKKSVTMPAVKSLLLEWDGDGFGMESVETAFGTLYKATDVIVQSEDIPGMTVTDSEEKETLVTDSIYNDMISRSLVGEGFSAKVAGWVWIAQKEAQAPGVKLPGAGIWLLKKKDGSYPKKVVLPAYREPFLQGEKPDGTTGEAMGGGGVKTVNSVSPDENGNVALAYDDLENKPFGEETGVVELMPETPVTVTGSGNDALPAVMVFEMGKTYIVTWDGTEYECEPFDLQGLVAIGNAGLIPGETDNGMPFLMTYVATVGMTGVVADAGTYTISIKTYATTIKTIDPKYLPEGAGGGGGGMAVVDLGEENATGILLALTTGEGQELFDPVRIANEIMAGLKAGHPVYVSFNVLGGAVLMPVSVVKFPDPIDAPGYVGGGLVFELGNEGMARVELTISFRIDSSTNEPSSGTLYVFQTPMVTA